MVLFTLGVSCGSLKKVVKRLGFEISSSSRGSSSAEGDWVSISH